MPGRSPLGVLAGLVLAMTLHAAPALAAPPSNDVPGGSAAGLFMPFTAENGTPTLLQATAELAEATPDAGVPRCLGPTSFARTVWYRLPEYQVGTEVTLEASGRTLSVLDLAAFVQDEVPPSPTPAPTPPPEPTPETGPTATPPPARAAQVQSLVREP